MIPKIRSLLVAMLGGMMAASLLHGEKLIDLGFGFARGGLGEGVLIAVIGAAAGAVILLVFRKLRELGGGRSESGKE
ncbi:MAG TPA: hypothetical protein VM325_11160 [Alphaproteobacteria bacterium]|nr:hypothetical protein [Alphaproteobacteria bacterium]